MLAEVHLTVESISQEIYNHLWHILPAFLIGGFSSFIFGLLPVYNRLAKLETHSEVLITGQQYIHMREKDHDHIDDQETLESIVQVISKNYGLEPKDTGPKR